MVKVFTSRLFWGALLVIGGILLLLDTFGVIKGNALFWTFVSALAGVLFITVYLSDHENWWALIPGTIFLTVAIAIGLDNFVPAFHQSNLIGPVILAGIALSFIFVYFADHTNWWAIIPAGVMTTIAIVAVLDSFSTTVGSAGLFFLGIGATFALVAMLPNPINPMRWAWIPAGTLGLMGLLILVASEEMINYIWPSAIIFAGIALIWRAIRVR